MFIDDLECESQSSMKNEEDVWESLYNSALEIL